MKLRQLEHQRWWQIDELFQEALVLTVQDRAAFLTSACAGDAQLRREVEALLATEEEADSFLATPPVKFRQSALPEEAAVGQRLGAYRLLRELGRGGMGAVYLAERADGQFQQQVALKLIKRGMDTDEIISRFRHERQILAGLNHPNIARLLDGGTTADGLPYFVMEYIVGQPIDRYCAEQQLGVEARLQLFRDVCAAVQHAHQNLVVHRDLKPSNILVTNEGRVELLDFGIAKLLHAPTTPPGVSTQIGMRVLTLDYASPEQVRGEPIATASDVYSLGVVLYELLTGQRPYDLVSSAPHEAARIICEQEAARPSTFARKLRDAGGRLKRGGLAFRPAASSVELDNIVLLALRKEPQQRYASVEQFSEDLRRYLDGLPVLAQPATLAYRAEKFLKRQRVAVLAAALVFLSLLTGLGATAQQALIANRARQQAVASLALVEQQRQRAAAAQAEAEAARTQAETERARAEAALAQAHQAQSVAESERTRAERRFEDVRKLANWLIFDFHEEIEKLPGATVAREKLIQESLAYLDKLSHDAGGDDSLAQEMARAYLVLGDAQGRPEYTNRGAWTEALQSYQKARAINEQLVTRDPRNEDARRALSLNYTRIGELLAQQKDDAGAAASFRQALRLRQAIAAAHPTDWRAQDGVAMTYHSMSENTRDLTERLALRQQALDIRQRLLKEHPEDAVLTGGVRITQIRMGDVLREMKDYPAALPHYLEALRLAQRVAVLAPGAPRFRHHQVEAHDKLADLYAKLKDYPKAFQHWEQALGLEETLFASAPTDEAVVRKLAALYTRYGRQLTDVGEIDRGLALQRKGLTLMEQLADVDQSHFLASQELQEMLYRYSRGLVALGKNDEALRSYQQTLVVAEKRAQADPQNLGRQRKLVDLYVEVGEWLDKRGELQAALNARTQGVQIAERLTATAPQNDLYRINLAKAREGLGHVYIGLAKDQSATQEQRRSRWETAIKWYQASRSIWQDLAQRGVLPPAYAGTSANLTQTILNCEEALARLRP
jgi:serine/threonine protein kinase